MQRDKEEKKKEGKGAGRLGLRCAKGLAHLGCMCTRGRGKDGLAQEGERGARAGGHF